MRLVKTLATEGGIPTEILTGNELCNKLGISYQTLVRWREDGAIPFMKIRSVIRYDLNKVLASIEFVTEPQIIWGAHPFLDEYIRDTIVDLKTSSIVIPLGLKIKTESFCEGTLAITFLHGMNYKLLIMPMDSLYNDDHWRAMLKKLFKRGGTDGTN